MVNLFLIYSVGALSPYSLSSNVAGLAFVIAKRHCMQNEFKHTFLDNLCLELYKSLNSLEVISYTK